MAKKPKPVPAKPKDYDRANHLLLHLILEGVVKLMSSFEDVKGVLVAVASGVDGLEAKIAELKASVEAGHVITQAELDELFAMASAIGADIVDDSDQV